MINKVFLIILLGKITELIKNELVRLVITHCKSRIDINEHYIGDKGATLLDYYCWKMIMR